MPDCKKAWYWRLSRVEILKNNDLTQLLDMAEGSQLSSIKSVVTEILQVVNDPATGVAHLKKIVECDPPLSARVLRRANSALYGFRRQISGIQEAIICIGFDAVKELAFSQKVSELFDRSGISYGYSRSRLWQHSVSVGVCSKLLYRREFRERGEQAYAAGLLHDLGLVVEEEFIPDAFRKILRLAHEEKRNFFEVEHDALGYTHADVCAGLAERWGLPAEMVEAIQTHHQPWQTTGQAPVRMQLALYASNVICQARELGYGDASSPNHADWSRSLEGLSIPERAMELIVDEVIRQISVMQTDGWF